MKKNTLQKICDDKSYKEILRHTLVRCSDTRLCKTSLELYRINLLVLKTRKIQCLLLKIQLSLYPEIRIEHIKVANFPELFCVIEQNKHLPRVSFHYRILYAGFTLYTSQISQAIKVLRPLEIDRLTVKMVKKHLIVKPNNNTKTIIK